MRPPLEHDFASNGHVPQLRTPNCAFPGYGGALFYGNNKMRKFVEYQSQSPLEIGCLARGHETQIRPMDEVGEVARGSIMAGFRHEYPRVDYLEGGALSAPGFGGFGNPIVFNFDP